MLGDMLDRLDHCKDNCLKVCRNYDVGLAVKRGKRGVPIIDWHVGSEKECSLARCLIVIGMMAGAVVLLYESWKMLIRMRAKCDCRRSLREKYRKKLHKLMKRRA